MPKPLSEREAEVDIRVLENHDGDFVDDEVSYSALRKRDQ